MTKRERVPGLAEAIKERRIQLNILSVSDLARAANVTLEGLRPLVAGERRKYQDRLKWPVCEALKWTPDSIDRLLRGEPAEVMEGTAAATIAVVDLAPAALEHRINQLEKAYREMAATVLALTERTTLPDDDALPGPDASRTAE